MNRLRRRPTQEQIYVVYHRTCGHVAGITRSRHHAQHCLDLLAGRGHHGWRIRTGLDGTDVNTFTDVINNVRCATCTIDEETR